MKHHLPASRAGVCGRVACVALLALLCGLAGRGESARAGVGPTIVLTGWNSVAGLTDSQIVYWRSSDQLVVAKSVADGSVQIASVLPDGSSTTSPNFAASPDGQFVVFLAGSDGGVYVRDLTSGQTQLVSVSGAPTQSVLPLAISNGGDRILVAGLDPQQNWWLWLLDRSADLTTPINFYGGQSVALSPDGGTVAWRDNGAVHVYDVTAKLFRYIVTWGGGNLPGSQGLSIGGANDRFIAYDSCPHNDCSSSEVDLYDRTTDTWRIIPHGWSPELSASGRYLAWNAFDSRENSGDIHLLDQSTGVVRRANIGADGHPVAGALDGPISDSGAVAWAPVPPQGPTRIHWTDQTPPDMPSLGERLIDRSQLTFSGRVPLRVWWRPGSPVCAIHLARLVEGDAVRIPVSPRTRAITRLTDPGVTARFQAATSDCEGDRSPERTTGLNVSLRQEGDDALTFTSLWRRTSNPLDSGGHARATTHDGAHFYLDSPGGYGQIAIVAATGPHRGSLTIHGTDFVAGIDLYSPVPHSRRIFVVATRSVDQTITFTAQTSPDHPLVAVDALLLCRHRLT
jgi:WD40 repeat protein